MSDRWFTLRINPEPWEIGPVSIGRAGGKLRPFVGKNNKLAAFQEAIREELDHSGVLSGEVEVAIFLWRQIYVYQSASGRKASSHVADATNMQKAIEDALQGVVIENDRLVRKITTTIMQQDAECEGLIVVNVKPFEQAESDCIPTRVWNEIQQVTPLPLSESDKNIERSLRISDGIVRSLQPDPEDYF